MKKKENPAKHWFFSFLFFFSKLISFWCFLFCNWCTAYEVRLFLFFFFFYQRSWNVNPMKKVSKTKAHNRTAERQLASLHTRLAAGGRRFKTKSRKICTTTCVDRTQRSGHLMTHSAKCHILLTSFYWVLFYFIKHTNNSYYIILPN